MDDQALSAAATAGTSPMRCLVPISGLPPTRRAASATARPTRREGETVESRRAWPQLAQAYEDGRERDADRAREQRDERDAGHRGPGALL